WARQLQCHGGTLPDLACVLHSQVARVPAYEHIRPDLPSELGRAMKVLAASLATFLVTFALVGCGAGASADPRTEAPLVRTAVVRDGTPASRSFTGTVGARVQSDLGFRVPGKITERFVDAGEKVRR